MAGHHGGGVLAPQSIGLGQRSGEAIPFAFRDRDGRLSFTNTFAYDPASDTWTWALDNIQEGKAIPFGRVTLTPHRLAATRMGPTM